LLYLFFRDPNSNKTLEVFDDVVKWVVDDKFLPEDIDEAKLSVFQQVNISEIFKHFPVKVELVLSMNIIIIIIFCDETGKLNQFSLI